MEFHSVLNFGQICGLLGPNGAGKTTSFYIIAGLAKSDSGQIEFIDQDITNMPMHKRSNLGIVSPPRTIYFSKSYCL